MMTVQADFKLSTFAQTLQLALDNTIREFVQKASEKFEIDPQELTDTWNSTFEDMQITLTPKSAPPTAKNAKNPASPAVEKTDGCPYEFTKGEKAGQRCGTRAKNGKTYCSKHAKFENAEQPTKKATSPKVPKSTPAEEPKKLPTSRTLTKHRTLRILHHKPTGLSFTKKTEDGKDVYTATGVIKEDKVMPLDDAAIENCKSLGFLFSMPEEEPTEKPVLEKTVDETTECKEAEEEPPKKPVLEKKALPPKKDLATASELKSTVEEMVMDSQKKGKAVVKEMAKFADEESEEADEDEYQDEGFGDYEEEDFEDEE